MMWIFVRKKTHRNKLSFLRCEARMLQMIIVFFFPLILSFSISKFFLVQPFCITCLEVRLALHRTKFLRVGVLGHVDRLKFCSLSQWFDCCSKLRFYPNGALLRRFKAACDRYQLRGGELTGQGDHLKFSWWKGSSLQ